MTTEPVGDPSECQGECLYAGYLACEVSGRTCADHFAEWKRSRELLVAALEGVG